MKTIFIRPFSCPAQEAVDVRERPGSSRRALRLCLAIPLAAVTIGASAQPAPAPTADSAPASVSTTLRRDDLRVALVAYRLALGGAALCPQRHPLTGMLFHHLAE
jgi:hypothetical protein